MPLSNKNGGALIDSEGYAQRCANRDLGIIGFLSLLNIHRPATLGPTKSSLLYSIQRKQVMLVLLANE
jgi:hypothetical protein